MPSFLEDIRPFYGTGERNAAGQTLEEFLEAYDPRRYQTPSCTTDAVILACRQEPGQNLEGVRVLLVKRSNHPSIGFWALPGGFVNLRENLEDTARRELEEETGVRGIRMEQLATYGDYDRDPRSRVITTAYMAIVKEDEVDVEAGDDAADAAWCSIRLDKTESGTEVRKGAIFQKETYRLEIRNTAKGLDTQVTVDRLWTRGLIREEYYRVAEQGEIAVDHGAILVQALVTIKRRLAGDIL